MQVAEGVGKGYVVTGGQDAIVNIFSLASLREDPNFSLLGHTANVCTLDTTPDGTIISGSWDQCVLLRPSHSRFDITAIVGLHVCGRASSSRMNWWDIHSRYGLCSLSSQTSS